MLILIWYSNKVSSRVFVITIDLLCFQRESHQASLEPEKADMPKTWTTLDKSNTKSNKVRIILDNLPHYIMVPRN